MKMDPSDQRRKRKRILRQPYPSKSVLSVRTLVVCFSFFILLLFLSRTGPLRSSGYRPVLVVSSLSLLSSATTRTVKSVQDFGGLLLRVKIESRVLFPDHVLLLVRGRMVKRKVAAGLECVYYHNKSDGFRNGFVKKKVLSVDEYDGFRSIVRCPIAPVNCSNVVSLGWEKNGALLGNQTVNSWDNLAYAATLDSDSVVVYVKGLNLRPDRESDPGMFSCHFWSGKHWGRNDQRFMLSTTALTAAQEVVRCSMPNSIRNNPDKAQGIRVTVGVTPRGRGRSRSRGSGRVVVPSVARISNSGLHRSGNKYELCVCTMVWNQASAIREWIMYHSWLGAERWFVYDNNSDDGIDEVIHDVGNHYNVTRHVWPWIKTQEAGFSHCALRARDECDWVAFMDVDEYFFFPYSVPGHEHFRPSGYAAKNALRAVVSNISSSSDTIAEIRTSCHSFGPSGLKMPPPRGVTVGYTCRLQSPERHKSIIRPDALDPTLLNVVHHFHMRKGFEYLNLPQSTAVINHYKYQVWDVFQAKFHRRVATYVVDWQENQNEGSRDRAPGLGTEAIEPPDWAQKFCEVWDTGLRDFVMANMDEGGLLPWEMHTGLPA